MSLSAVLFYLLAFVTGTCAVGVVVTQNIVRAAAWLLFTLAGTAGVFFLLQADFVGATQLLIYVGGTLVLVVFGVMLTAQGPFINMRIGAAEWTIAMAVGLLLYGVLTVCFLSSRTMDSIAESLQAADKQWKREPGEPAPLPPSIMLGQSLLGLREASPPNEPITGIPANRQQWNRSQMTYLLPFEIVSVHLLVVLIGAAYLARAKRRRGANV
jgi:NADH:ubiquinone oxidoreductase subunit 6 (subunit J)